ncbi:toxin [Streptomyces gobiensis]|uniref:toxin n=1 Tax=Streptomyces gobiensis TaxID=2875706 RepID=UPI001E3D608F|nr:toxin [Streptomyces gobiensis]UGY91497.1 toxin [Streptomyces gobiensis]
MRRPRRHGHRTTSRGLRRECRRHLAEMPLPDPFSLPAFVRAIEEIRGRRILLLEMPDFLTSHDSACGLWVKLSAPAVDLVFYVKGTTAYHQEKIVLHELAHVWCDDGNAFDIDQFGAMFPLFGPKLVKKLVGNAQVRGRTSYDTRPERRAEILADLIHHAGQGLTGRTDDALGRLEDSLSRPVARRRR